MQLLVAHSPGSIVAALLLVSVGMLWKSRLLLLFALVVCVFILWFFRGFDEAVNPYPNVVVSPCDGLVLHVRRYRANRVRIIVGLNLFDRHVQIAPVSGTVLWQNYKAGEFNPVFFSVKTHLNERMETAFESPAIGVVALSQVAGQIARRIVSFVQPGQEVRKGDQVGLIKFGSQCELDLPMPMNATLLVTQGQRVRLGQDIAVY